MKAVQGLRLIAHFSGSLSNQGTNRTYGISRTKSTAQQTVTHQLPNPLAIENIRFTTGNLPCGPRIDEVDRKTPRIEKLEQGYPVHPGSFHRHDLDLEAGKPIGKMDQIVGERTETTNRLLMLTVDRDPMLTTANVNAGTMRVDEFKPLL
ncbi:hypothetical protein D3C76_1251530 [compost metagenome]